MKNFIKNSVVYILIGIMFLSLIPGIALRVKSENKNDNVVVSFLYNDLRNKVSSKKVDEVIDKCIDMGIGVVSVMEDDLNNMVARGEVTCIKFNVLCHKYDDESIRVANAIREACPNITYDSYIVLAKKDEARQKLEYMFGRKYTEKDYMMIKDVERMDIYVLYDGRKNLWNYTLGYDENLISNLASKGFDISLIHKVTNFEKTDYLSDIDRIVKEYGVEYFNLKESDQDEKKENKKNYLGLADIINKNNMTLVVTESVDQLSNQKFTGYNEVFEAVMGEGGSKKVLRSYETYDDSQDDGSHYQYRETQFFNSTVDRNIRFITLTQIATKDVSFDKCADFTLKAAKNYIDKIQALGYSVNEDTDVTEYNANMKFNNAVCAVIMILCLLLMWQMISGKKSIKLIILALVLSVAAFLITFKMPLVLLTLYPTAYCVVMSTFAMTVTLYFVKTFKSKLKLIPLVLDTVVVMLLVLFAGAIGMGTMLSGINYYINNYIFRGIKLSLIIPVFYTAIVYYFMFMKDEKTKVTKDIKKVLMADIKVFWVLIGLVIGAVGVYYIIRSGNVNKISGIEQAMRNFMTEVFPARPRTKEFLIGYPALVLFAYYVKNHNIKLLEWVLAVGASILAASITNSFCHVFTDFTTICMRVVNGLTIGIIVSAVVYVINLVFVKVVKAIINRI